MISAAPTPAKIRRSMSWQMSPGGRLVAVDLGSLGSPDYTLRTSVIGPAGGRPVESLTGRRGFDGAAVAGCGWISSARSVRIFHDAFAF